MAITKWLNPKSYLFQAVGSNLFFFLVGKSGFNLVSSREQTMVLLKVMVSRLASLDCRKAYWNPTKLFSNHLVYFLCKKSVVFNISNYLFFLITIFQNNVNQWRSYTNNLSLKHFLYCYYVANKTQQIQWKPWVLKGRRQKLGGGGTMLPSYPFPVPAALYFWLLQNVRKCRFLRYNSIKCVNLSIKFLLSYTLVWRTYMARHHLKTLDYIMQSNHT